MTQMLTYEDVMRIARESYPGFYNGPDADGTMVDSIVGITAVETFARAIEAAVITNLRKQDHVSYPKTRKVKMLCWTDKFALMWRVEGQTFYGDWIRVPAEDKIIEVSEEPK